MRKFFAIILCLLFLFPLYAQEAEDDIDPSFEKQTEELKEEKPKKSVSLARRYFEFGIDAGVGVDNNLIKLSDVFKEDIVIDLEQLNEDVGDDGLNININVPVGLFFNIKNIEIAKGIWDVGFSSEIDSKLSLNVPKSFFELVAEGNIEKRSFEGTISASGYMFLGNGINISARYGKLRLGVKPAFYTPLVFIPKSGIDYKLVTEDSISFSTQGAVKVYSPRKEDGTMDFNSGVDLSLNGEYAILRFLDVGGGVFNIPLSPAVMRNYQSFSMPDYNVDINGEDLMNGNAPDMPSFDFNQEYGSKDQNVLRTLKMDFYLRLKPFLNEVLVIKPNIGFSRDMNDESTYFNFGVEGRLNLIDLLIISLSCSREEAIWTNRAGFALNLRMIEVDLAVSTRSETFTGSFSTQGLGVGIGLRLGW